MSYREHPAISQSELKRFISGSFGQSKESDAMKFGSLVDMMLTQEDKLDETYAIVELKIGDKPKQIVDHLLENNLAHVELQQIDREYLKNLMDIYEYRGTYKDPMDDRRFEKLYEECSEYYNLINSGKIIIDEQTWNDALIVRDSILEGQFTQGFHRLEGDVYNQLEIYWSVEGIDVKSMLDRVIVVHEQQMIGNYVIPAKSIVPIDYKVIQTSTRYFNIRKFRYDIQGSFYLNALKSWMLENDLYDYELLPFHFIVGGIGQTAYVHVLSDHDRQIGEYGGIRVPTDKGYEIVPSTTYNIDPQVLSSKTDLDVLGWRQGIYLYKWYQEHHVEMQYDKEAIENNGVFYTNAWGL